MNYTNPANLAVIACPGAELFAKQVVSHLKSCFKKSFAKMAADLAKRYDLDRDAVVRQLNFIREAASSGAVARGNAEQCHTPHFNAEARFSMFANGEVKAEILESVRGKDVYIVQDVENRSPVVFNSGSVSRVLSVNDHLFCLLVTIDAAKQAGAQSITAVLPVYPYSRQHKKKSREGVTASRVGNILESMHVNRVITLDIHSREIGNSFGNMRLENLHASYQIIRQLAKVTDVKSDKLVVASPDTGAIDRNKFYATALKKPLALLYKERDYSRISSSALDSNIAELKLLGNVQGKTVFMADDMIGTGGTLLKAMRFLKENGAGQVICAVSLPIFSGNAVSYFDEAYREGLFYKIIGTNAVHNGDLLGREWYVNVDITRLFAQIISRLRQNLPLSSLLDNRDIIVKLFDEK
jgi:ribose-phosphate pyrophosphokinase